MNKILSAIAIMLVSFVCKGQTYPMQARTSLLPPYSVYLTDYGAAGENRLQVQLDFNDPSSLQAQVRLGIKIEGQGISLQTDPNFIPDQPITLLSGVPSVLMGRDLATYLNPDHLVFQGLSKSEYKRTGRLPEGFYQVYFYVMDYRRGTALSNPNTLQRASALFILNDPPLMISPQDKAIITAKDPQFVLFQWIPQHVNLAGTAVNYEFQLVEVWPANRNPNDAFLTSPLLYTERLQSTSLAYSIEKPALIPGRTYAVRVQAKEDNMGDIATHSGSLFKNNGYSQVMSFQYKEDCQPPLGLNASIESMSEISIHWYPQINHLSTQIAYKLTSETEWRESSALFDPSYAMDHLHTGDTIAYKVKGLCQTAESEYTLVQSLKIPQPIRPVETSVSCSNKAPATEDIQNRELINGLKVGDIIKARGFDFQFSELTQKPDQSYRGKGVLYISSLKAMPILMAFESLKVNTDKVYLSGNMHAINADLSDVKTFADDAIGYASKIRGFMSQVDIAALKEQEGNKGEGNPFLAEAIDAVGYATIQGAEAIADVVKEAPSVPKAVAQEMQDLQYHAAQWIEEAKEVVAQSPEKAAELVEKAADNMQTVANTLSSLPNMVEDGFNGLNSLTQDGLDKFNDLIREAIQAVNDISIKELDEMNVSVQLPSLKREANADADRINEELQSSKVEGEGNENESSPTVMTFEDEGFQYLSSTEEENISQDKNYGSFILKLRKLHGLVLKIQFYEQLIASSASLLEGEGLDDFSATVWNKFVENTKGKLENFKKGNFTTNAEKEITSLVQESLDETVSTKLNE